MSLKTFSEMRDKRKNFQKVVEAIDSLLEEYVVLERCEPEAPKAPKTLADYTSKELAYELLKRCGEGKNK